MPPKTILMVDSDVAFIELLKIIFDESDYHIESSNSSDDIIGQISLCHPAVILIDTWLHGSNAVKITNRIRQDLYLKELPVILMGTHSALSNQAQEASADDYLFKPFDIAQLEQMVFNYSSTATVI